MERGLKSQIARATGKTPSFITQYFKDEKGMSWDTAKKAHKAFPMVELELWMNRELAQIERKLTISK